MSNVMFLPTLYQPSIEERMRLAKAQEDIHFTKVQYFFQLRKEPAGMIAARKAELHKMWQSRWVVYDHENPTGRSLS